MRAVCIGLVFLSSFALTDSWVAAAASNQESADNTFTSALDKRVIFYGGMQVYQAEGDFSSTRTGRPKFTIDLDDIGLDDNAISPVAGAFVKLSRRWSLRFDYFGYHEDATKIANSSFEFDRVSIPFGARVDSSVDLDIYVLSLSYAFIHTPRFRMGAGVGVHAADIDLEISGSGTVANREVYYGEAEEDFIAPLPNLYLSGAYAFSEKIVSRISAGWLDATYEDYSGELITANVSLEYWPFQHTGFGIGYRYVAVDVEYSRKDKTEVYDVELPGPLFYMTVGF